jgi:phytoene dehydrogenase-like protein
VTSLDAVVVGSGPNGLVAAVLLARAGLRVEVLEGMETPGGGCRTEDLTIPGFHHDVCSTVQALATASPVLRDLDLPGLGVRLCAPEVAVAHPLDSGTAASVVASVDETAGGLGRDAESYARLMAPLVAHAGGIVGAALSPPGTLPREPVAVARFAALGVGSVTRLSRGFRTDGARALLAGVGAHAVRPLDAPLTAGIALVLTMVAHTGGWPVVEGGSARLTDALVRALCDAGGTVRTGEWVTDLDQLPASRVTLLDTSPRGLASLAGARLADRYARSLERFTYGPGVCKVDWALSGPVPWAAAACRRAGTVHVGGTFEEVAAAEAAVAQGLDVERPFCIVVQPCVADPTRAPAGRHTLWAYCHVPPGSSVDMTSRIEAQIERFAPGFGALVLARATERAADVERRNPNYVGGDINGGAATLRQTLFRPTVRWRPYRTALRGLYLCSASTPPGGGVHGMCGAGAARAVLRDLGMRAHG